MGDVVKTPLRGNDGLYLTLGLAEGGTPEEYEGNVKKWEFTAEDKDDLTFREVMDGDTKVTGLKLTIVQSFDPDSLYRLLWDNPAALFDCVVGPYGNAVPSASKPHLAGEVKGNGRPGLSAEARTNRQREEVEVELTFDAQPELVTVPG